MSVQTEADVCRDMIKKSVEEAIQNTSKIVIDRCWGSDEYNDQYHKNLKEILWELMEIREKME